jgi:hypothetical protein
VLLNMDSTLATNGIDFVSHWQDHPPQAPPPHAFIVSDLLDVRDAQACAEFAVLHQVSARVCVCMCVCVCFVIPANATNTIVPAQCMLHFWRFGHKRALTPPLLSPTCWSAPTLPTTPLS